MQSPAALPRTMSDPVSFTQDFALPQRLTLFALKVNFFFGLNDDKAVATKQHLDGFAAATTEEGLERNIGLELGD